MTYTVGSVFSGIGGLDLAFEAAGMRIAWQVEIDGFCNTILQRRWPDAQRVRDVRDAGRHNLPVVDIMAGWYERGPINVTLAHKTRYLDALQDGDIPALAALLADCEAAL